MMALTSIAYKCTQLLPSQESAQDWSAEFSDTSDIFDLVSATCMQGWWS